MFAQSTVIVVKVLKSGQKYDGIYWEEITECADGWEEVPRKKEEFNDESSFCPEQ